MRGAPIHFCSWALICGSLLSAASAAEDDWPVFRGDPSGSGVARSVLPGTLELLWKFPTKEGSFEATPVVAGGVVYVGNFDGNLYAIDLETGRQRWSFHTDLGFSSAAAVADGRVLACDSDGVVYCLAAADGKKLWQYNVEAENFGGPNLYKDLVLVGSQNGTLYALRRDSGELAWKYTITDQIRCSPTVAGDRALLSGCDARLHIIDLATGQKAAEVPLDGPAGASPAVLGDQVFLGTHGRKLLAIDWRKAKETWSYESPEGASFENSSAAAGAGIVVVGSFDKRLHAIRPDDGQALWTFAARGQIDTSPVISGERIYFGANDGRVYGVDRAGKKVWSYEIGGRIKSSPAVSRGRLLIGSKDGTLYCFGAKRK